VNLNDITTNWSLGDWHHVRGVVFCIGWRSIDYLEIVAMKTGAVSKSLGISGRVNLLPWMVAVIMVNENYFDDFIVAKDVRVGVDAIDNRIRCLFSCRQSCV
jgi:hypothetical protein